ncbi:hypothetical protein niasHT_031230 [Heterodera trifolii]|uniref:RNA-directed DNA polymerase n=1 Tax=Heterodera trifolii TaxID=157864 RepID=A0ABD2IL91_9BILA
MYLNLRQNDDQSSSKDEDVVIAQFLADTEADVAHVFNTQTEQLPLTAKEIAEAQRSDPLIRKVLDCTMGRWPNKGLNPEIKAYFTVRNNLSIISDCLVFNGRTIIPQALRDQILKALHLAHPGIVRMKSLVQELVYWPSMDTDIESLVKIVHSYNGCLTVMVFRRLLCPTMDPNFRHPFLRNFAKIMALNTFSAFHIILSRMEQRNVTLTTSNANSKNAVVIEIGLANHFSHIDQHKLLF